MKSDGPLKHFILAFLLAAGCYAIFYQSIEHRRTQKGPWRVTFATNAAGPVVIVNQPKLVITNVQISFPGEAWSTTNALGTLIFAQPKPVPFAVPFGDCIFMDTTFLPGTVTFRLFGHEIQLLPRVLMIDEQEHQWLPNRLITRHPLTPATNQVQPQPER